MYPSLEDMKATELIKAQVNAMKPVPIHQNYSPGAPSAPMATYPRHYPESNHGSAYVAAAYPSLTDFMGLELTEEMIRLNMPEYSHQPISYPTLGSMNTEIAVPQPAQLANVPRNNSGVSVLAPISGSNAVVKSMITHGVRQVTVGKDTEKLGLRVRAMNTGVFVCLVIDGSPAAKAGLRFGDQILQIDGEDMAGKSVDKVHTLLKKKNVGDKIEVALRDRPFERTVTLVRDSVGNIGFQFRDGKIINIVKDSSAARNGLLTEHALLEINGKNVIGLKDKEITKVIQSLPGNALTVTIMPGFLYSHMVKEMAGSLFGKMDHSNPDF